MGDDLIERNVTLEVLINCFYNCQNMLQYSVQCDICIQVLGVICI